MGQSASVCPQTGPPDTLAGRQLLIPTCHTAVAALLNGAGEREVKKLNLLTLPFGERRSNDSGRLNSGGLRRERASWARNQPT